MKIKIKMNFFTAKKMKNKNSCFSALEPWMESVGVEDIEEYRCVRYFLTRFNTGQHLLCS
jgi:hypothetical protein